jgi:hypothetical protein
LDKGILVDVNAQQILKGLNDACRIWRKGQIEIVKPPLDNGADVNSKEAISGLRLNARKFGEITKLTVAQIG